MLGKEKIFPDQIKKKKFKGNSQLVSRRGTLQKRSTENKVLDLGIPNEVLVCFLPIRLIISGTSHSIGDIFSYTLITPHHVSVLFKITLLYDLCKWCGLTNMAYCMRKLSILTVIASWTWDRILDTSSQKYKSKVKTVLWKLKKSWLYNLVWLWFPVIYLT